MSNINVGADIKNYGDVTKLIIDLINGSNEFRAELIINLTVNYVEGSSLEISEKDIVRMVHNILDQMQKYGNVSYANGIYTTKSTDYTLAKYYEHTQAKSIIL